MEQIKQSFNRRAFIYSIVFHGALFLLMLKATVLFEVEEPQFFEMNLGTVSQQRLEQILEEARRTEAIKRLQEQGLSPEDRVNIPERKMIEIEEPTISVSSEQRIESHDIVTEAERQAIEVNAPDITIPVLDGSIFSTDRKENFQGSKITIGEQPGTGIETSTIGSDFNIIIEGEIKGRDIVSDPHPVYPEGLNKSAVIKIKFEVLPDGSVSSSGMVPVRKENAVLEELTMNTLKLWRFSPLSPGDERKQAGTITFNYSVK
ncbi:hypothetical protein ACFL1R_01375 [Candidatus Latescibacterota bacterium]